MGSRRGPPSYERAEPAFYGGSWGSLGNCGHLRKLITNQKAAGSSPAERAPEDPVNTASLFLRYGFRTGPYSPFDHLSPSERLPGYKDGGLEVRLRWKKEPPRATI